LLASIDVAWFGSPSSRSEAWSIAISHAEKAVIKVLFSAIELVGRWRANGGVRAAVAFATACIGARLR
jgi:hypothetical protein